MNLNRQFEIEKNVLSSLVVDLEGVFYCLDRLNADDFSNDKNRLLWGHLTKAAVDLNESNRSDLLTYLVPHLTKDDYEVHEILDMFSAMPSSSNLEYFVGELKEHSKLRKLTIGISSINKQTAEEGRDFETAANELEDLLFQLNENVQGDINFNEVLHKVIADLETPGAAMGHSWGLTDLDNITAGIERGKTYVVGGLKKSGKTKFALNTSMSLWRQDVSNAWISLEMGRTYLMRWILSHVAGVDSFRLKTGKLHEADWPKIHAASNKLAQNNNILLDDRPGLTVPQIRSVVRKFARKGAEVVFIDFLQRINIPTSRGDNRATAIQKATVELADMAKEYNVAIVYLSQINNAKEHDKELAGIGDLKESGGIGENVDCAIVINNMDRISKTKEKMNIAKLVIEQRDGASDIIEVQMDLAVSAFRDKAHGYQEVLNGKPAPDDVPF